MIDAVVGPYRIVEWLGEGGMGEVFLGHDPRLDRRVALKRLTVAGAGSPDAASRILREARAAARLTHAHIAGIYDVLEHDGHTYIVMEYVEGVSLSAHLAGGPRPPAEVRAIGRQIASALAAAHAQGVIHRDLKPANIQVMRDGSVKVLDFGVARLAAAPGGTMDVTRTPSAVDGTVEGNPGTPTYMAPEQLVGGTVDARSDIYSAGVVLFEMATGRRPYLEINDAALAVAMSAAPPPPARDINPRVPADLSDAIAKALERDPDKRFQSATDLEAALTVTSGTSSVTRDPAAVGRAPRTRRRWIAGAAAALVALALGAGATRLFRGAPAGPAATSAARRQAVAVLPLENLSGDPSKAYLGAGVAETLTMALSKMPDLTVLSRNEVQEVLRRQHDVRSIARDLDVSFVVDGSVQQSGDRLRITLRLVRPDGTVAWSEAYEDESGAIFSLHRTMAVSLLTQMEGRANAADIDAPSTQSVAALTAYWQGRAALDRAVTPHDFAAAEASFRQAVASDSQFALAYAGLTDALWQQYQATHDPALPDQALDAGLTAVRLDGSQPAARVALATAYQGVGKYDAAAEQLRRALELQPASDDAHRMLGRVLALEGRPDEAIAEYRQAVQYRPRRWANYNALGGAYYQLRRLPEAVQTFQRALEIAPNDPRTYLSLGAVYTDMGELPRAIDMFEQSTRISPTGLGLSNLGTAYYRLGRFSDAVTAYESALALDAKSPLLHGNLGDAYLRVNRTADAKREFTTARELALAALRVNAKDPRMLSRVAAFEAKLGLHAEAAAHAAQAVALAPKDPDVNYKQAVVAALAGDVPVAIRALEQAITLGYKVNDARNDYDLAAIRNSPEFAALLARFR